MELRIDEMTFVVEMSSLDSISNLAPDVEKKIDLISIISDYDSSEVPANGELDIMSSVVLPAVKSLVFECRVIT